VYEIGDLGWEARGVLNFFTVHSYMEASQRRKLHPIGLEFRFTWVFVSTREIVEGIQTYPTGG
jgi:hypothetical protein